MHLDTRTLVVVASFVALVPSVIAASVLYTRRTCPGFGRWTLGNLLATVSLVFLGLRGTAPDWISVVLANALAVGAAILFFQGIRLFCGLRLYGWPEYLTGSFAISAVIYFTYVTNHIDVRILVMSLWMGGLGLACGNMLLRAAPLGRRFSVLFTAMVFALAGAANLFRGLYVWMYAPVTDLFAPSAINAVFFGGATLCVVSWSFGFILMTNELTDSETLPGRAMAAVASSGRVVVARAVPEAEVRQQVQRIVSSDVFRRSARMEQFLTLTVERALLGYPEGLKEYALGRDLFNRGEDYDPRMDSIVRVEAVRLRRKIREYYGTYGRDDSVIVEFHTGSYVPAFRYRTR